MIHWNSWRGMTLLMALVAIHLLTHPSARGQGLSVVPVNVMLGPNQRAATLSLSNHDSKPMAIQIRTYAWNQKDGNDQLTASDQIVASPPIATIAPGAIQVVRLILRQPPVGREVTYRILVDQIPPPAEVGVVHMVLRLSIPIFAQPATRAVPLIRFHIEHEGGQPVLVAVNHGLRHEVLQDICLHTSDGRELKEEPSASPYILGGSTRRWRMVGQGLLPLSNESLLLTAHGDGGPIQQTVAVEAAP